MSLWLIALIALVLVIYLTHPSLRRGRLRPWREAQFAHRGLHDAKAGVLENTLPAFKAARNQGYGIELDVQLTKDGQIAVFHDDDLARLCGDPRKVAALTLDELQGVPLKGTEARIPTLPQALAAIDGRVPLLIEVKNGGRNRQLCQRLMDALEGYAGDVLVESFNPLVVGWFRRHAPGVIRGQLVGPMRDYLPAANQIGAFCMAGLLLNFIGRPDFVAYDVNAARFFSPHFQRFMFRTPMAAWTVRNEAQAALVRARREMCIFEKADAR